MQRLYAFGAIVYVRICRAVITCHNEESAVFVHFKTARIILRLSSALGKSSLADYVNACLALRKFGVALQSVHKLADYVVSSAVLVVLNVIRHIIKVNTEKR